MVFNFGCCKIFFILYWGLCNGFDFFVWNWIILLIRIDIDVLRGFWSGYVLFNKLNDIFVDDLFKEIELS